MDFALFMGQVLAIWVGTCLMAYFAGRAIGGAR